MTRLAHILAIVFCVNAVALPAIAQGTEADEPVVVTYGGWSALGGAAGFSLFTAAAIGTAGLIYAVPAELDCRTEPDDRRCRASVLQHTLVALTVVAAAGGIYVSGWGGGKLAETLEWNPTLGWSLAGGYLGLPAGLLLQNAIPSFQPDWLRQGIGLTIGAGSAVGAAYAFGQLARADGQAWPEFGFGAGGMGLGLLVGTLVAKDSAWVPILGGLGAVVGASAAAVAF